MGRESERYAAAGRLSSKAGMLSALSSRRWLSFLRNPSRTFAEIPLLFPAACGWGRTKSIVAYLAYRETGETHWFRSLAQEQLVMISTISHVSAPSRVWP